MLSPEVRRAIEEGNFSIYTVERIKEVIELLMDITFEELIKKIEEKIKHYKEKGEPPHLFLSELKWGLLAVNLINSY